MSAHHRPSSSCPKAIGIDPSESDSINRYRSSRYYRLPRGSMDGLSPLASGGHYRSNSEWRLLSAQTGTNSEAGRTVAGLVPLLLVEDETVGDLPPCDLHSRTHPRYLTVRPGIARTLGADTPGRVPGSAPKVSSVYFASVGETARTCSDIREALRWIAADISPLPSVNGPSTVHESPGTSPLRSGYCRRPSRWRADPRA